MCQLLTRPVVVSEEMLRHIESVVPSEIALKRHLRRDWHVVLI